MDPVASSPSGSIGRVGNIAVCRRGFLRAQKEQIYAKCNNGALNIGSLIWPVSPSPPGSMRGDAAVPLVTC